MAGGARKPVAQCLSRELIELQPYGAQGIVLKRSRGYGSARKSDGDDMALEWGLSVALVIRLDGFTVPEEVQWPRWNWQRLR
ncbi:hypothetical protein BaRGS_00040476 [Batillaria attramentaria]|uniref:ATP-dependent DNA ligase family profile domain-containing protein n=1 Tax=Batillaria attramentaria TaxID=370345 RepID=A0ABD0IZY4_9CAEN